MDQIHPLSSVYLISKLKVRLIKNHLSRMWPEKRQKKSHTSNAVLSSGFILAAVGPNCSTNCSALLIKERSLKSDKLFFHITVQALNSDSRFKFLIQIHRSDPWLESSVQSLRRRSSLNGRFHYEALE